MNQKILKIMALFFCAHSFLYGCGKKSEDEGFATSHHIPFADQNPSKCIEVDDHPSWNLPFDEGPCPDTLNGKTKTGGCQRDEHQIDWFYNTSGSGDFTVDRIKKLCGESTFVEAV